ncbi:hypothetical protein D3C84_783390 [compost metagenome]
MRLPRRAHATGQAQQGSRDHQRGRGVSLCRSPGLRCATQAGDHSLRFPSSDGHRRFGREERRAVGGRRPGEFAGRSVRPDVRADRRSGRLCRAVEQEPARRHRRQQEAGPGAVHLRPRHSRCRRRDRQGAGTLPRLAGAGAAGLAASAHVLAGCRPGSGSRDSQLLRRRAQPAGDRRTAQARPADPGSRRAGR